MRGEAANAKHCGEAVGVKLVGLIDVAHHELGLGGVGEKRQTACGFDLVGDPVPVADALECDGVPVGNREKKEVTAPG
jgi:hypothetical protein